MPSPVLVIDNGAYSIKAGISTEMSDIPRIVPNAIVRTTSKGNSRQMYIGHEIESCRDYSSLQYRLPFEKGYLTDWDLEKAVWDRMFDDVFNVAYLDIRQSLVTNALFQIDPQDYSLLVTEPYFNLSSIQETYDQLIFEEWEFDSYYRATSAALIPHGNLFDDPPSLPPECMLIVDSGFSFTYISPVVKGNIIWSAVRRIDVGGKLLTNHLKELVSFRQWNMMEETYIVNSVKESCCYVSQDFESDLKTCSVNPRSNPIVKEYVLPDFSHNRHGFMRTEDSIRLDTDQVLYMNNERFSVPEVLFRPSDIGMNQSGIAETIAHSISSLPEEVRGLMWANIGLLGGNVVMPGFETRLLSELRSLAPVECEVSIYKSDDPVTTTYQSALSLSRSTPKFTQLAVTRTEYLENGSEACRRKFKGDWRLSQAETTRTTSASVRREGTNRRESAASRPEKSKLRATTKREKAASAASGSTPGVDQAAEKKTGKRGRPPRKSTGGTVSEEVIVLEG